MTALIRLYPPAWRERYEAEFLGILEARPPSGRDRLDIIRGAFDARLHPEVPGSPDSPQPSIRPARAVGVIAIVAGLAWLAWFMLLLGDVGWLTSGESKNAALMGVVAGISFLSLAAVHVALGVFGGVGTLRQVIAILVGSIAVFFFVLSGLGVWWAPVLAVVASAGFAVAAAGRAVPAWLATPWTVTSLMALGVFLGGLGDAFGAYSAFVWGLPYGLLWVLVGAMFVARGIPARATVADGSG